LEYNISTLETLSENRQSSSLSAITQYRVELNELVQNDDSVSKDLKSQYKKETANLNSLEKEGVRLDAQIKQKQTELEEANSDYENLNENIDYAAEEYSEDDEKTPDYSKQLSNAEKNISKLESDLSGLQTKRTKNSQSITNSKTNISSLQDKIKSQSVTLKQKMNEINQKIEAEQAKCEKDIQSYNNSITALKNAQSYAVSKVQENSAKSYSSSNESVGNGSDTYVYDESNYDSAAVSALEQKWSKIAKKQGLDTKFFQKVTAIAKDLKCDPNALLSVMNSESGLNSSAVNKNGGATGLIQFMPSTAKAYGTTTQQLAKMSAYDQLDYVAKFLISTKKTAKMGDSTLSAADLYSLIFLPGRANRDVLTSSGEKYYSANAGLDMDGDGKITKSDLEKRMKKFSA
jgi:predicted  nucleic acid-binding Zn-ribbon protein